MDRGTNYGTGARQQWSSEPQHGHATFDTRFQHPSMIPVVPPPVSQEWLQAKQQQQQQQQYYHFERNQDRPQHHPHHHYHPQERQAQPHQQLQQQQQWRQPAQYSQASVASSVPSNHHFHQPQQRPLYEPQVYDLHMSQIPPQPTMMRNDVQPVQQHQYQQTSQQAWHTPTASTPQQTVMPSSQTVQSYPVKDKTPTPEPPLDVRLLLLALADQYVQAARKLGHGDIQSYQKLMASGLACLERVTKAPSGTFPPRQEATIQLRYASLLFEETENNIEVETVLGKAIVFCKKHRLLDLRYGMEHLLSRALIKTRPKVALKNLDDVIKEATLSRHTAWVYAFRFFRASLIVQMSSNPSPTSALSDLKAVLDLSRAQSDEAIAVATSLLQATLHLRQGDSTSLVEAQRALASARATQTNQNTDWTVPQLDILLHCIDVACCLNPYEPGECKKKVLELNQRLETAMKKNNRQGWQDDGVFLVPTSSQSTAELVGETGNILATDSKGRTLLKFSWLSRTDALLVSYLLSAIGLQNSNKIEDRKSEKFLREGLRVVTEQLRSPPRSRPESATSSSKRSQWRETMKCYMLVQLAFALCNRSDWAAAKSTVQELKHALESAQIVERHGMTALCAYVEAVAEHGAGNLEKALALYQSVIGTSASSSSRGTSTFRDTVSTLASLNILLIVRPIDHPQHSLLQTHLDRISATFSPTATSNSTAPNRASTNPHLQSAYHYVLSVLPPSAPSSAVLQTKQQLQRALNFARQVSNNHLITLCLNFMCGSWFAGIVGEQAEKSAKAARATANEAGSSLWACVAGGMLSDTLEREGKAHEAQAARSEALGLLDSLPNGPWCGLPMTE